MDRTYEWLKDGAETDFYQEMESLIKKNPWAWQSVCAVLGLAGGVSAPFLGAASDVITWFANSTTVNSYLHVLSIVFCALTIPLIALGACCLDLLEAKTARLSPPPHCHATNQPPASLAGSNARQNAIHPHNRTGALAGMRCKDYFQVRKYFECLALSGYSEQRGDKLRLPLRIASR